jgi:cystathionine beta-lyase/cystathionine gamma-synthase
LVVDNTFASPYLQEPLKLGADIAVHSTTKYLSGHSDLVDGAVVISDDALYEKVRFAQNAAGGVPGPLDCWLVLRGIKTFAVRMDRHCSNAQKVAEYLSTHPKIDKVLYPGLASHPQHLRAKEQMSAFGGMISFYLKGDFQACRSLLKHVKIFTLAESRISDRASEFDDACLSPEGTERKCRRKRFVSESLSWN